MSCALICLAGRRGAREPDPCDVVGGRLGRLVSVRLNRRLWAHVVRCAPGMYLAGRWGAREPDPWGVVVGLLDADDGHGGVPEAFEVVVGPLFGGEEVEDDVAVVQ